MVYQTDELNSFRGSAEVHLKRSLLAMELDNW